MRKDIKERIELIKCGKVPENYKIAKLGIVPTEWQEIEFSKLFKEKNERTNNTEKFPLYSLTLENGIVEKSERYEREHLVKKEDSTYKIVECDEFAYNPMNIRFGAVARNKSEKAVSVSGYYDVFDVLLDTDRVFFESFLVFKPMLNYYNKMCTGSLAEKKRVHFGDFLKFKFVLPKENERKCISQILSKYDQEIEFLNRKIYWLKERRKIIVKKLFSGKVDGKGEWEKCKVKDVVSAGSKDNIVDTSKYKRIIVKLNFGGLEFNNTERELVDKRPLYVRKKGEIIVGKQNYFNGSIALIDDKFDNTICSNAIMSFRIDEDKVLPVFLLSYLSQPDYINRRSFFANGTGQKELSEKDFLDFDIEIPSYKEQDRISSIIMTADKEINLVIEKQNHIIKEKEAMMQLLFMGIVRTSEI